MMRRKERKATRPLSRRERLHEIIFEADTPTGRAFDVVLLLTIVASVVTVMLESIDDLHDRYATLFLVLEWGFTVVFTIEYILRLYCVYRPWQYATSFFGVIDLLAILPTYLTLLFAGTPYLIVIRVLRLLRVFRVFKLGHYLKESFIIVQALRASRAKITVFLTFVLLVVTIVGSAMYLLESEVNPGFSSIPRAIYWAIVTITTVGYGDIVPITVPGQFLASFLVITGYAVLAVPTGIVSAEFIQAQRKPLQTNTQVCRFCAREGHDDDAKHCKYCGELLNGAQ